MQINRSEVKTSDNKIHHFSITKLGKKRKRNMQEPKETIIEHNKILISMEA